MDHSKLTITLPRIREMLVMSSMVTQEESRPKKQRIHSINLIGQRDDKGVKVKVNKFKKKKYILKFHKMLIRN